MDRRAYSHWRRALLIAILLLWALGLGASWVLVPRLVLDGFDKKSWNSLNERIDFHRRSGVANGEDRSREWYSAWGQGFARKGSMLSSVLAAGLLVIVLSSRFRTRCTHFLFARSAAINLGILRAVVFVSMLVLLCTEPIAEFADWERSNFEWPSVGGLLLERLPINGRLVRTLLPVAIAASALAMVGWFSRTSALVACVLSFYLLGIPQCSGKVNHTMHHVWLIAVLMACSRCGDAFSLDSLSIAVRRADGGLVRPLARLVRYGLPIRLSMLLLASCYFFPGFWKLASNGFTWIFSDNLQNQLLQKWFELETYEPPLPLYELPGFIAMGALTAVVFEIGFPLALLWRPTRVLWAGLGILFHNMTRLMMNISFYTMQSMYVMFVDWQQLLACMGRVLYKRPLIVLYDGDCKLCRRTISILLALDWLGSLRAINALLRHRVEQQELQHLDSGPLLAEMHVARRLSDNGWLLATGFHAYRQIAWRIPLLWPLVPLLYLPPVVWVGSYIYRSVAHRRACSLKATSCRADTRSRLPWSARPLVIVAGILLAAQVALGMGRMRTAWPVACYPLFDTLSTSTILWPEFEAIYPDGRVQVLDDDPLRDYYTESRYVPKLKRFVSIPLNVDETRTVLRDYTRVWQHAGVLGSSPPASIAVYIATYHLTGPKRPSAPAHRTLVAAFNWADLMSSDSTQANPAAP